MMKKIYIQLPADFSFAECRWFLDRGFDDCVHRVNGERVMKALQLDGRELLVEVMEGQGRLEVKILQGQVDEKIMGLLSAYIREWMDIDRNLIPFYTLLKKDKRLAYMCEEYRGLRLVGIVDLFEALAWSIIGQQINLKFAFTLKRRLVEKYGTSILHGGGVFHLFPDAKVLAAATVEELRPLQFSGSKAAYLIGLAKAFASGELSREALLSLPDRESRLQALMKVKGIGIWTANYCLMKSLRDPSGIPHGDTGLLTALSNHGVIRDRKELAKIERFFAKYKGWESYLVFYLWRSLAVKPVDAPMMSLPPPIR
jgi:DNA-3-methyladenine glycosylase II